MVDFELEKRKGYVIRCDVNSVPTEQCSSEECGSALVTFEAQRFT
jgi:hypothetical protein